MNETVFTIGHSNHGLDAFVELLRSHGIISVGDVRSTPYSRMYPQFNRETIKSALERQGIKYTFLGKQLGARSDDPRCYAKGQVVYEALARTPEFKAGLQWILNRAPKERLVLMCAEKDPLTCHRSVLVARNLPKDRITVQHVLADGTLESQDAASARLLKELHLLQEDLFRSPEEVLSDAYRERERTIAYKDPDWRPV